jgi:hypothetical protein
VQPSLLTHVRPFLGEYFGFTDDPFGITPDPRFFYRVTFGEPDHRVTVLRLDDSEDAPA